MCSPDCNITVENADSNKIASQYNETISNLIKMAKESKNRRQYDEFIHTIQQAKMKELWGNTEDEAWENA
jgi:hypothetical protein